VAPRSLGPVVEFRYCCQSTAKSPQDAKSTQMKAALESQVWPDVCCGSRTLNQLSVELTRARGISDCIWIDGVRHDCK
jgi:hypothetical protein